MDAVVGQNDKVNRYLPDVRLGDIENVVVESLRDYYLEIDDIRLSEYGREHRNMRTAVQISDRR